jgi:uncharacterized protein YgiM (DUF1202 family)
MRKTIIVMLTVFFLAATPAIASAGRGYHGYRGGCGNYCGGYGYGGAWAALGIGLLTGVVLSAVFTPPPTRTVVYQSTAPVVVQPGPAAVREYTYGTPSTTSGTVSVNVGLLNVRSAPGLHQGIVSRVRYGEVLTVFGAAPGWLNVRTPSGSVGWVMAQYTAASVG